MILGVVIFLYWEEPVPRGLLLDIVGGVKRACWIALLVRGEHEDSLVRGVILTRLSRGFERGGNQTSLGTKLDFLGPIKIA